MISATNKGWHFGGWGGEFAHFCRQRHLSIAEQSETGKPPSFPLVQIRICPFQSLASHLLSDPSSLPEFKEQLSRLLNAIASFSHGRDYLLVASSQGRQLIYETAMALKGRRVVGHAVEHLLAALQKLSIRTGAQKELLMNGKLYPQMNKTFRLLIPFSKLILFLIVILQQFIYSLHRNA
jgi:hypothetical protein